MLFAVTMDVNLPPDLDPGARADTLAREKAYSQETSAVIILDHLGLAGRFANLSIFEVDSHEELHDILWNLPLFPYMTIEVTPLAQHPSDIAADITAAG